MPEVTALRSFEHSGKRARGTTFMASDQDARKLAAAGLVSYEGQRVEGAGEQADPTEDAGVARRSSASPAGRASRKTTAAKSTRGGKRK
jgi:hypothetical protein